MGVPCTAATSVSVLGFMKTKRAFVLVSLLCIAFIFTAAVSHAIEFSKGQTVYVPAALHSLPSPDGGTQLFLTRVIITNLDMDNPITITSVAFYDPYGNLVTLYSQSGPFNDFISGADIMDSLTSNSFIVNPFMTAPAETPPPSWVTNPGGGRPFYIVKWESLDKVVAPNIEGATIIVKNGVYNGVGYRKGVVLEEK